MHPTSGESEPLVEPPRRIAQYTLLLDLARGGMAQVFIAQRDGSREVCVVKKLHAELQAQQAVVRRFHREANLASQLSHPNLARIIDAGFEGRELYIALEYIAGQTLEAIVQALNARQQRLPMEGVVAIAAGVLDALSHAHEAVDAEGTKLNLVHRDLSPRNVMLSYAGEVKLIDFGVARGNVDRYQTEPGVLLGTLRYFSPEQSLGDEVDLRSDLYSLSVLLWELFAGQCLISPATPIQMLSAVHEEEAPLLSTLDPTIPRAIEAVVAAGLAKERDERWQTARELRDALLKAYPMEVSPGEILGPLMTELFPSEEVRFGRMIAEARARLPYDPARMANVPGTISFSDLETRTRTEVLPTQLEQSEEQFPTDPTLANDATKVLSQPPRIIRPVSVALPPPQEKNWIIAGTAMLFVVVTCLVAVFSARIFGIEERLIDTRTRPEEAIEVARPVAREEEAQPKQREETPPEREKKRAPQKAPQAVSPPKKRADTKLARIEAKLEQARDHPDDPDRLAEVHTLIREASAELDGAAKSRIRSLLDKSVRSADIEPAERAFELLKASRRREE
jgi:serine/threonine protein kinase